MVSLQNRRNLFVKYGLAVLLLLSAVACTGPEQGRAQEHYRQLSGMMPGAVMDNFDHYLVVFPFRCMGCVEHKLDEWLSATDSSSRARTVLVYDTGWALHSMLRSVSSVQKVHIASDAIEKAFPKLANICVFNRGKVNGSLTAKVVNADDSSLLFYMKGL